jgi:hypothetical protein
VIHVERKPNGYTPPGHVRERACDEPGGRLLEVEVVEREVEARLRSGDELTDVFGDLEGALAPVRQCPDFDRQAYPRARK